MVDFVPDRGDVVWVDFDPQKGREMKKHRPALVITKKEYNRKTGLALCLPITSKVKGYPFEIPIDLEGVKGAILLDHIRSLDWQFRKAEKITKISSFMLHEVTEKLKLLIDA
jgi:mRNA interferase MazF